MAIGRTGGVRAQHGGSVGDPLPLNQAGRLAMRFFRSCVLFVAATTSLMAGGSLAVSGGAPAGASPAGITVHCPADNLQDAINSAAPGSTLLVDGICTGNFYIDKNLTLSGPATLDGGGVANTVRVDAQRHCGNRSLEQSGHPGRRWYRRHWRWHLERQSVDPEPFDCDAQHHR